MRPTVTGPADEIAVQVGLEAWALFDTWMQNDPTGKHIEDPAERVRYFCSLYGEFLRPAWREWRARLGQPVIESPPLPL